MASRGARGHAAGATLAGQAFANARRLHALAHPLGGRYHSPRALQCADAAALEFNMEAAEALYAELRRFAGADVALR